jgi:hypothetical protein
MAAIGTGERVPGFTLRAANRDQEFALPDLLARGSLVIEFLRGTW